MNDAFVLDTNFNIVGLIDKFTSFLWVERYYTNGDFELYIPFEFATFTLLQKGFYLRIPESERVMIIEKKEMDFDPEKKYYVTITGKSLETIINRRIVWQQTVLTGNLQTGIHRLLTENVIAPTNTDRTIPNFIFEASIDVLVTAKTVDAQYTYDNLFDVIQALCESNGLGFKITLSATNQFVFKLYAGKYRTYDQLINQYVIFSPNFENLVDSQYLESDEMFKNTVLVGGEGEGTDRILEEVHTDENITGLSRRETFVDASDLSLITDDHPEGQPLTDYKNQLKQRGMEALLEAIAIQSFEGSCDESNSGSFILGRDYDLGDVVQVENEYGIGSRSRVIEVIRSRSETEDKIYPTFN